jgi:hypothetical protein
VFKVGRPQSEQMSSRLPLKADISRFMSTRPRPKPGAHVSAEASADYRHPGRTGSNRSSDLRALATTVRDYAALFGAAGLSDAGLGLGGAPGLILIVLVVFTALAGFLIVRCSTPLSK